MSFSVITSVFYNIFVSIAGVYLRKYSSIVFQPIRKKEQSFRKFMFKNFVTDRITNLFWSWLNVLLDLLIISSLLISKNSKGQAESSSGCSGRSFFDGSNLYYFNTLQTVHGTPETCDPKQQHQRHASLLDFQLFIFCS